MTVSKKVFSIGFDNIGWLDGLGDDSGDYCAHAHAVPASETRHSNTTRP